MTYSILIKPSHHKMVTRGNETILDAALRSGLRFPYSCRNGSCGSCRGFVVQGDVTYPQGVPPVLTASERQAGCVILCQAVAASALVIEIDEVNHEAIALRNLPARVRRLRKLSDDVMGLWLQLPKSERLQFLAGQYIEIIMREGRRRAFSLANAPHDDEYLQLHIRHYPGGVFSDLVFSGLKEGGLLQLAGPFGAFYLREDSPRPVIMIAGGTGFAPIKAMVEHAFHQGMERDFHMYWGVRTQPDLYLDSLAAQWSAHPRLSYEPVLSEPDLGWPGRKGLVHKAVLEDFPDLSGFDVYASGPPAMIEAIKATFVKRGLPRARLYSDAFESARDAGKSAVS